MNGAWSGLCPRMDFDIGWLKLLDPVIQHYFQCGYHQKNEKVYVLCALQD